MLGQHLRCWANLKTSLFQRVVFAGISQQKRGVGPMLAYCWANINLALFQRLVCCDLTIFTLRANITQNVFLTPNSYIFPRLNGQNFKFTRVY